mmetsp:Transcript_13832/g.26855  ORF Transcript_13832/g.26855 Transcript_13832/m.26855 type:complete len:205 (+) Transcript_13832:2282-2896(+)
MHTKGEIITCAVGRDIATNDTTCRGSVVRKATVVAGTIPVGRFNFNVHCIIAIHYRATIMTVLLKRDIHFAVCASWTWAKVALKKTSERYPTLVVPDHTIVVDKDHSIAIANWGAIRHFSTRILNLKNTFSKNPFRRRTNGGDCYAGLTISFLIHADVSANLSTKDFRIFILLRCEIHLVVLTCCIKFNGIPKANILIREVSIL